MYFVGDVHGKFDEWAKICEQNSPIIQLGDMGIGFSNCPYPESWTDQALFIRGNHDNPEACRKHPNYLGDFGFYDSLDMFFVSGARSTDQYARVPGYNWWNDEELTRDLCEKAMNLYEVVRPRVVVSHDCPKVMSRVMTFDTTFDSLTSQLLTAMWEVHKPVLWVFSHYHQSATLAVGGTLFKALGELEVFGIPKGQGAKLWVDDERQPPEGWWWAKRADIAIVYLTLGVISEVSLDHDLGEGAGSGYEVASFLEEAAWQGLLPPIKWQVHSMNLPGKQRMIQALKSADRLWASERKELVEALP
jgi:hypothetical protein